MPPESETEQPPVEACCICGAHEPDDMVTEYLGKLWCWVCLPDKEHN